MIKLTNNGKEIGRVTSDAFNGFADSLNMQEPDILPDHKQRNKARWNRKHNSRQPV